MIANRIFAQNASFGNTFIHTSAEMVVHNVQHNFQNGSAGVLPGIIGTERTSPQGYLGFAGTGSWIGASSSAYVDGYVKSYLSTAFTFPIGDNGKYRPAAVSAASLTNPANAAYYATSGTLAVTSSLKGGNEPKLPSGGTYATDLIESGLMSIDNVEYWDINGDTSAKITLTWDVNSSINTLTGGDLTRLTIVGWDGLKWVSIPSTYDANNILGGSSTTTAGSITTNASIIPNTYDVYTLGVVFVCNAGSAAPILFK